MCCMYICIAKDTVLSNKSINDVQYPLRVHKTLKAIQHVVIPYKLAAGRREGARVGPHLSLQGEGGVIGVAEVKVA